MKKNLIGNDPFPNLARLVTMNASIGVKKLCHLKLVKKKKKLVQLFLK